MDYSPPGSSVHGIVQARILEWVAIPSPGDLPDPGIEPGSPALQADSLPTEPWGKPQNYVIYSNRPALLTKKKKKKRELSKVWVNKHRFRAKKGTFKT